MEQTKLVGSVTHWNTGRLYTKFGQQISACIVEKDGKKAVQFKDWSRGIDGQIELTPLREKLYGGERLPRGVMSTYDRGDYEQIGAWDWVGGARPENDAFVPHPM